ncbi:DUF3272 family protein [uncultured Streptococcus sp.]|uniref:DUF3272 family protein n=1 Tax=uncultured Streptococcus sp. TaxID=83427 RepID=UPI0027DD9AC5|nr:DUF3272 family protein [uncultured Streptococcus sp.]
MNIRQFIFVAFLCAFETYFFNDSIMSGDYIFAVIWGILLYRDLRRVWLVSRFTKAIIDATKKKD